MRGEGLEGRELKDAGDLAAHELLMTLLAEHRPDDAVLSEEGKDDKAPARRPTGSGSSTRSTAPASSPSRRATTGPCTSRSGSAGDLAAGAVAQPALGETFSTGRPPVVPAAHRGAARGSRCPAPARRPSSRRWPPSWTPSWCRWGRAGVKVISVVRDVTDAYVHAGGQYEWDNAAPVAVARAAGLFCSRVDGSQLALQPGRRLACPT